MGRSQVWFRVSLWAGIFRGHCRGCCWLLNDKAFFLKMFLKLWNRSYSFCTRSSTALWETCLAVVEHDFSRKTYQTWRVTAWLPRLLDLIPIDFSWEDTWSSTFRQSLPELSKIWWLDFICNNGRSQRLKACSREFRASHCSVPWNERRQLRIPTVNVTAWPQEFSRNGQRGRGELYFTLYPESIRPHSFTIGERNRT
jgi:hypothetical protein